MLTLNTAQCASLTQQSVENRGSVWHINAQLSTVQGRQIWHQNWVILAPNGTNLGLFKDQFQYIWLGEPKCTETDPKKSQICPIWGAI